MANKWRSYLTGIDTEEEEKKKKEDGAGAPSSWADYLRSQIVEEEPEPEKPVIEAKKIDPEPLGGFETAKEKATNLFTERLGQTATADRIRQREAEQAAQDAAGGKVSLFGGTEQAKSAATDLFRDRVLGTAGAEKNKQEKQAEREEEERKNETVRNQEWLDSLRTEEDIRADLDAVKEQQSALDKKAFRDNALGVWYDLIGQREKTVQANEETRAAREGLTDKEKALEDELAQRTWANYESKRNNRDFAVNSAYKSTANGNETKLNPLGGYDSVAFDDPLYEYVNGNEEAGRILAMEKEENARQNGLLGFLVPQDTYNYEHVAEMTDDERAMYNYIHETEGGQAAYEYLDYLRSDLYRRQMEKEKEEAAAYAEDHPILSTVATVGLSPLRGAAFLGQAADYLTTGKIDENAPYNRVAALPAAEREEVTRIIDRKWGEPGTFAYGVGVSMAEFLLNSFLAGGKYADKLGRGLSLAIMGTGAAPGATIEAKERGLNDTQAFAVGTAAGAAEIITELVSLEALFSNPWEKTGLKNWMKKALYVGQNIAAEGSEEGAADILNMLADLLIAREKSEWIRDIKDNMEAGMDENRAFVKTLKDRGLEILKDAAAGAASGGIMASEAVTLDTIFSAAQKNRDRSQAIEAVRAANNEARANAAPDLMKGIRQAKEQAAPVSPQKAAQTQAEPEGGIVLPTAENEAGEAGAGTEMRVGAEPETASPLKTAEETELDERVAKARNVTEATGIRYGVDERTIRKAERIGRMLGKTVQFYEQGSKNGTAENGFYNPKTGEIFYNVNAKQKLNFTLAHEFTHTVEGTEAYENLHALVLGRLAEEGIDVGERRARVRDTYERAGIGGMTNTEIDQEIVADWVGDHLSDERTIREICREDASVGKRIRDTIDDFLVRAGQMQGVVTEYEERKLRNAIGIYDKYLRRIAARETAQETAQETQETPQSVQETGAGQTAAEAVRPAETQGTPVSERVRARMAEAKTAEPMGMADLEEGGEETPDEYLARMNRLYEDGEITAEEYDEAVELAEEMRDTGLGAGRTTVARDAGPEGKIPAAIRRMTGRYSVSEADDEAYMDAVKNGDTETAQRMVDEAARNAGYNSPKLYHGTDYYKQINIFKPGKSGYLGPGIYLTPNKSLAKRYADRSGDGGRIYSAWAKIQNPLNVTSDEPAREILREITGSDRVFNNRMAKQAWSTQILTKADMNKLRAKGYDGIIWKYGTSPAEYMVFESSQIKSADPVTYDENNEPIKLSERFNDQEPDIRYSVSEAERRPISDEDEETRKHRYDYDTLVGKGSIKIIPIQTREIKIGGKKKNKVDYGVMHEAVKERLPMLTDGEHIQRYLYIRDIGENALINSKGITHGMLGRLPDNNIISTAEVTPYLPEILQNSVAVNEIDDKQATNSQNNTKQKDHGEYTIILFGMARDENGQEYLVKSSLNHFGYNKSILEDVKIYNVLKGIRAKEIGTDVKGSYAADAAAIVPNSSVPDISISQLLNYVKRIHPEFLSDDVRKRIGVNADKAEGLRYSIIDEEQEQGPIAAMPQAKLRDAALRTENRLAANLADIFGVSRNRTSDEYKTFKAEVVRPVIEAMLQGQTVDADALFREHWSGSLTEGQRARADYDEAMADARQDLRKLNVKSEEVRREAEAKALWNAELDSMIPDTTEELVKLGQRFKDAKKRRTAVMSRIVLTEEEQQIVDALATGRMTDEEAYARSPFGIDEILEAADAERQYRQAESVWSRYKSRLEERRIETADGVLENADKWKDKGSGLAYARETAERNFRDIAGEDAEQVIDTYLRPIHKAEAASTRFKNSYIKRVKDLGLSRKVGRGNTVSEAAAVQWLGEAEDNVRVLTKMRNKDAVRDGQTLDEWKSAIEQFRAENPNLDYDKVRRGIAQFQTIYGELITEMNRVLVENGYEPVNIRSGYFPHFNGGDDGVLAKFAHLLGINIENQALPTSINGLTSSFKPGKTWFGHALERTGFRTDYDAVQGFEGYIGGVSDVIHHTANLRNLRTLASRIRYKMGDEGIKNRIRDIQANDTLTTQEKDAMIQDLTSNGRYKLSRAVAWLDEYANLLANKKSKYDRGIEDLMGRRVYTWMKNIEGRVAANMIAGNLGSALTNFIPLNQAASMIGDRNLIKGAAQTVANMIKGDGFVNRSDFLTNRRGTDPLIQNRADKIAEFLSAPMNLIDNFASEAIVRGAYNYYRKGGMDEESALDAANEFAAGVMADRSKGALPTIFGSKNPMMKLFTQFQVEVNNEFSTIFKDVPKGVYRNDRDRKNMVAVAAWTLLRYFVGAYLFNDLYESIVGRRAALDPLGILDDTVGDLTGKKLNNIVDMLTGEGIIEEREPANPSDAITETGKNVLEELPFVGGLLGGGRIPISSALPDAETIVKGLSNENWSASKKAQTVGRELGKTVGTYILPPFAGGALKKAYQTAENTIAGGRFVKNAEGEDQIQYPYFTETPAETAGTVAKSLLFGPTATEGGRDWVERGFGSQSAKNTALYRELTKNGESQRASWDLITGMRGMSNGEKRDYIAQADISDEGKALAMETLLSESEGRKFRGANEYGVSAEAWAALYDAMADYDANGNSTYSQAEIAGALENIRVPLGENEGRTQGLFGGSSRDRALTGEEKAVLWAAYGYKKNGNSWKQSNNPYDPTLGEQVIDWIDGLDYGEEEGE